MSSQRVFGNPRILEGPKHSNPTVMTMNDIIVMIRVDRCLVRNPMQGAAIEYTTVNVVSM